MREKELLDAALPYLTTVLNLHSVGVAPCMSQDDAKELMALIDEVYDLLKEKGPDRIDVN